MGVQGMVKRQIQQHKKQQQLHIQRKQVAVTVQLLPMLNRHMTKQKGGKTKLDNK